MKKSKRIPEKAAQERRTTNSLMSATEMTGLIPAGLEDEMEADSYEDMASLVEQKPKK